MHRRVESRSARTRRVAASTLALAACASANAQNFSVPFKATYRGSVEARAPYLNVTSCAALYTVPAGMTFRVTDILITNYFDSQLVRNQNLCTGRGACSSVRAGPFSVQGGTTFSHSFTTGVRVDAGDTVYACNYDGVQYPSWTVTGFLYSLP